MHYELSTRIPFNVINHEPVEKVEKGKNARNEDRRKM
jgi:hypothetical protein